MVKQKEEAASLVALLKWRSNSVLFSMIILLVLVIQKIREEQSKITSSSNASFPTAQDIKLLNINTKYKVV